jgi:glycine dehydrogenase subunit 1
MGPAGLREIAEQNVLKTDYAVNEIAKRTKHRVMFTAPRFNEFVVNVQGPCPFGLPLARFYPELERSMLLCVTETARRDQIDAMVERLAS